MGAKTNGVYECTITGLPGTYADKRYEVKNNNEKAQELEKQIYKEYLLGRDLFH